MERRPLAGMPRAARPRLNCKPAALRFSLSGFLVFLRAVRGAGRAPTCRRAAGAPSEPQLLVREGRKQRARAETNSRFRAQHGSQIRSMRLSENRSILGSIRGFSRLSSGRRWPQDGMRKWEVILSRALSAPDLKFVPGSSTSVAEPQRRGGAEKSAEGPRECAAGASFHPGGIRTPFGTSEGPLRPGLHSVSALRVLCGLCASAVHSWGHEIEGRDNAGAKPGTEFGVGPL